MSVPILDYTRASPIELVAALASSSCVFLVNHPLDDAVRAEWIETARQFFDLDPAEKAAVRWCGQGPWRGWQPVYDGGPQAMLLERFEVNLAPGGQDGELHDWGDTFTQWPHRPPRMRPAWTRAYAYLHAMASDLTVAIAAGLGLPERDLPAWTERQHSNLVVNHYLTQHVAPQPGQVRQRPHTDIGGLTLLWADDAPGGLEAEIDGDWVPVHFPPGALLLQAGDLLHLWSRSAIPANNHRVVNPPREPGTVQTSRYSAVFFHHPDLTTWVAPAPGHDDYTAEDARSPGGVEALAHVLERQRRSGAQDSGSTG